MSIEPAGNGRPPEHEAEAPASKPLAERHPDLSSTGERFALLVDALRDMTDDMVPHFEAIDTSRLSPDALAAMDALPPARRARLKDAVTLLFEKLPADEEGQNEQLQELNGALDDAFQDDLHLIGTFFDSLVKAAAGPDRVSIMRNSMLLQLISGFEVLVASVATRFFITHPSALESTDRDFSLAELRTFSDLDDAIDTLIATAAAATTVTSASATSSRTTALPPGRTRTRRARWTVSSRARRSTISSPRRSLPSIRQ